jgi:lipoyl(octanoyl) transferase
MSTLYYQDLGRMQYSSALTLQEQLVGQKKRKTSPDYLLFVEHPHVYTIGRGGDIKNVVAPREVPVHRTSRGGDVTYHGPGQVVVYPIIDLRSKLRKDVHRYLRNLETAAIRTLQDFTVKAGQRPPYTGIWIDDRKIAAVGLAVSRGITYHGLALNVNPDLSYFRRIIPCGLQWADVTSMAKELGKEQSTERVKYRFLDRFAEVFDYSRIENISNFPEFKAGQNGASYEASDDR